MPKLLRPELIGKRCIAISKSCKSEKYAKCDVERGRIFNNCWKSSIIRCINTANVKGESKTKLCVEWTDDSRREWIDEDNYYSIVIEEKLVTCLHPNKQTWHLALAYSAFKDRLGIKKTGTFVEFFMDDHKFIVNAKEFGDISDESQATKIANRSKPGGAKFQEWLTVQQTQYFLMRSDKNLGGIRIRFYRKYQFPTHPDWISAVIVGKDGANGFLIVLTDEVLQQMYIDLNEIQCQFLDKDRISSLLKGLKPGVSTRRKDKKETQNSDLIPTVIRHHHNTRGVTKILKAASFVKEKSKKTVKSLPVDTVKSIVKSDETVTNKKIVTNKTTNNKSQRTKTNASESSSKGKSKKITNSKSVSVNTTPKRSKKEQVETLSSDKSSPTRKNNQQATDEPQVYVPPKTLGNAKSKNKFKFLSEDLEKKSQDAKSKLMSANNPKPPISSKPVVDNVTPTIKVVNYFSKTDDKPHVASVNKIKKNIKSMLVIHPSVKSLSHSSSIQNTIWTTTSTSSLPVTTLVNVCVNSAGKSTAVESMDTDSSFHKNTDHDVDANSSTSIEKICSSNDPNSMHKQDTVLSSISSKSAITAGTLSSGLSSDQKISNNSNTASSLNHEEESLKSNCLRTENEVNLLKRTEDGHDPVYSAACSGSSNAGDLNDIKTSSSETDSKSHENDVCMNLISEENEANVKAAFKECKTIADGLINDQIKTANDCTASQTFENEVTNISDEANVELNTQGNMYGPLMIRINKLPQADVESDLNNEEEMLLTSSHANEVNLNCEQKSTKQTVCGSKESQSSTKSSELHECSTTTNISAITRQQDTFKCESHQSERGLQDHPSPELKEDAVCEANKDVSGEVGDLLRCKINEQSEQQPEENSQIVNMYEEGALKIFESTNKIEENALDTNKSARDIAENARNLAESARALHESAHEMDGCARDLDEDAQSTHESSQNMAENARNMAESARAMHESAHEMDECARDMDEDARGTYENSQDMAEVARDIAESAREMDESAQEMDESACGMHKSARKMDEGAREIDESAQDMDESARNTHESAQDMAAVAQEMDKCSQEMDERAQDRDENERETHESAHGMAKSARELDESAREMDECARKMDESAWDTHESAREMEESAREMDESAREMDECARKMDESAWDTHESAREMEESAREMDESAREMGESAREMDENAQEMDENAQEMDESAQKMGESAREMDESAQKMGESAREMHESAQKMDESAQEMDQTAREMDESAREMDESAREMDESAREMDQTAREMDESAREMDESAREMDENARKMDENARKMDESAHYTHVKDSIQIDGEKHTEESAQNMNESAKRMTKIAGDIDITCKKTKCDIPVSTYEVQERNAFKTKTSESRSCDIQGMLQTANLQSSNSELQESAVISTEFHASSQSNQILFEREESNLSKIHETESVSKSPDKESQNYITMEPQDQNKSNRSQDFSQSELLKCNSDQLKESTPSDKNVSSTSDSVQAISSEPLQSSVESLFHEEMLEKVVEDMEVEETTTKDTNTETFNLHQTQSENEQITPESKDTVIKSELKPLEHYECLINDEAMDVNDDSAIDIKDQSQTIGIETASNEEIKLNTNDENLTHSSNRTTVDGDHDISLHVIKKEPQPSVSENHETTMYVNQISATKDSSVIPLEKKMETENVISTTTSNRESNCTTKEKNSFSIPGKVKSKAMKKPETERSCLMNNLPHNTTNIIAESTNKERECTSLEANKCNAKMEQDRIIAERLRERKRLLFMCKLQKQNTLMQRKRLLEKARIEQLKRLQLENKQKHQEAINMLTDNPATVLSNGMKRKQSDNLNNEVVKRTKVITFISSNERVSLSIKQDSSITKSSQFLSDHSKSTAPETTEEKRQNSGSTSILNRPKLRTELRKKETSFVQDASCQYILDIRGVHTKIPKFKFKCMECRKWRGKKNSQIFCRFYGIRKLKFHNNNLVQSGFLDPEKDCNMQDLRLWLPSPHHAKPKKAVPSWCSLRYPLSQHTCSYILKYTSIQFCNLIKQELEAFSWISDKENIYWKRPVVGVREMCDCCETTMFNLHWMCPTCGFGVCLDCFRKRRNKSQDELCVYDLDETCLHRWAKCVKNKFHVPSSLMPVQIIPSNCMREVLNTFHEHQRYCGCSEMKLKTNHQRKIVPQQFKQPSKSFSTQTVTSNGNVRPHGKDDGRKAEYKHYFNQSLLRFIKPGGMNSTAIFQYRWARGQCVMVSGVHENLNMKLWHPDKICEQHGNEVTKNALVNCMNGAVIANMKIRDFWEGFEDISRRLIDEDQNSMILKLKDWPTTEDFEDVMPQRFRDLMQALPMPEYSNRSGLLNLATRLPSFFAKPDLGPKMYNAYGWVTESNWMQGTTNLHLDISDAVNVMVYVGIPIDQPPESEDKLYQIIAEGDVDDGQAERAKTDKPGALWHIFKPEDTDKIRKLIRQVSNERGEKIPRDHDPIHDQQIYLTKELRRRLRDDYGATGVPILQCEGDSVFIPAGAAHQVFNLNSCIKVAEDFVSPEHISKCFKLTHEFRYLSSTHSNHEDKLQIKSVIYHSVKDVLSSLMWHKLHEEQSSSEDT